MYQQFAFILPFYVIRYGKNGSYFLHYVGADRHCFPRSLLLFFLKTKISNKQARTHTKLEAIVLVSSYHIIYVCTKQMPANKHGIK